MTNVQVDARDFTNMRERKFLVVGATGHVGSKVAIRLAEKGYDVTAMVRQDGATIRDPFNGVMKYVVGDLRDSDSIREAVKGMDVVISTANGILPQRKGDNAKNVNEGALRLIGLCEEAGVARFVQSSVPPYKYENDVPELRGKRLIEARLKQSSMQSIVIRNAAFMDVFLPMGGFRQAQDASLHATTKREYDFARRFMAMTGDLVEKYGVFLAPGGADHGTPIIATRDVAEMMVGGALYEGADNLLIEAGGPEWLTWRQIAAIIAKAGSGINRPEDLLRDDPSFQRLLAETGGEIGDLRAVFRDGAYDTVIDTQGLLKSALIALSIAAENPALP